MKKYLFGIFAIVLAIGFSAFKTVAKSKTQDVIVFGLDATGENYVRIGELPDLATGEAECSSQVTFEKCVIAYDLGNDPELNSYAVGTEPSPDQIGDTHGWFDPQ